MMLRASAAPAPDATAYEDHRDYVLGVLGRRCSWLDPSDREAVFHEAYAVFLEKQRGGQLDVAPMRPAQIRAYLTQTALNKAMDEGKRAGRRRSVSLDDDDLAIDPADPGRALDERIAASFDDSRVREIVAELPERQQTIIKLRFFFERTPDEVQSYLGVTERVYRRELERATRHIAERVELVRQGTFCESRRSLILAFVTGVAGPGRILDARRHLATCPGCASWARDLRATLDRAAEVIPLPAAGGSALEVLHHHHHLLGTHHPFSRIAEHAHRARLHLVELGTRLTGSPVTAVTGTRPGAAAAAIAGCLAAGTGGTYCAVNGIPRPLGALVGLGPAHAHASKPRHHASRGTHRVHVAAGRHAAGESVSTVGLAPPPPAPAAVSAMRSAAATPTASRPVHRQAKSARRGGSDTSSAPAAPAPAPATTQSSPSVVQRATAPEFGVGTASPSSSSTGGGSSTGGSTSSGGSSSGGSTASISPASPSSSSTAPKPSSHSSEFDP